jgi:hypothetical protein
LAVFTGSSVTAFNHVANSNNDCSSSSRASALTFQATAGTTYRIDVDGSTAGYFQSPEEGSIAMNVYPAATSGSPPFAGPPSSSDGTAAGSASPSNGSRLLRARSGSCQLISAFGKGAAVPMHGSLFVDEREPESAPRARGLIGVRNEFLTETRGTGILHSLFERYEPWHGETTTRATGSLVADRRGSTASFALMNLQGARPALLWPRPGGHLDDTTPMG